MKNADIRFAIMNAGLKYWEVAEALNIADTTFTKWLRKDLPEDRRQLILDTIRTLSEEA